MGTRKQTPTERRLAHRIEMLEEQLTAESKAHAETKRTLQLTERALDVSIAASNELRNSPETVMAQAADAAAQYVRLAAAAQTRLTFQVAHASQGIADVQLQVTTYPEPKS